MDNSVYFTLYPNLWLPPHLTLYKQRPNPLGLITQHAQIAIADPKRWLFPKIFYAEKFHNNYRYCLDSLSRNI